MARDIAGAGRSNEARGRIALVARRLAVLVGIIDHNAQPRTEGLEAADDFRIGQIIDKDVGEHVGVGLAFVEEVEEDAARLEAEPRIRPSLAFEWRGIEIQLRLADRRNNLALVGEVALVGLRTGKAAREADIKKRPARGAMRVDRRPRGGLGDNRVVAVRELADT